MSSTTTVTPVLGVNPRLTTLMIAAAMSPLAINIFVPSLPQIVTHFSTTYATAGLGLSLFLAAMAVLQLIIGPLSDRFGRRPVMLGGVGLFIIGTGLCLFAPSIEAFLAGRLVQACAVAGIILSRAIVRDLVSREKAASAIGYVTMGMAVAPMIAPAIGGLLDEWYGWQASFVFLGFLGAMGLIALAANLPETNAHRGAPMAEQLSHYGKLSRTPAFWLFAAAGSSGSAVFFAFLGGAPALASGPLGLSPSQYGLWFAIGAIGYMIGNFMSGRFSERVGIDRMIRSGALITLAGCALPALLFATLGLSAAALFGPTLLLGIGNGMLLPNTTAAAISVRPDAAGAASGVIGSAQTAIGAILSATAGAVVAGGEAPMALALLIAGASLIATVFAYACPRVSESTN
ncbi:MAG: multidrug effflux MFS transporter [Rhizobiaceae bacterium]|jgi:DHA1 family bicyclomycin/chloramphenicol resistance-like MFS transporter|nr:multidrug effflux MFS transporter [Rhizobiaceae bacterium]